MKPSRPIAKSNREAPTAHAKADPNALIPAPSVTVSPSHFPTYMFPRSPISDGELMKAATPLVPVPNPKLSAAVATKKNNPATTTVPNRAIGIARFGLMVSSPNVVAASNPAKDRKPNVIAKKTLEIPSPLGRVKIDVVSFWPLGPWWIASLTKTMAATMTIKIMVSTSTISRTLVAALVGREAKKLTPSKATAASISQLAWPHRPTLLRNVVTKSEAPASVVTVNATYVPNRSQPATKPDRGPSVAPTNPYTEPAWAKCWHRWTKA